MGLGGFWGSVLRYLLSLVPLDRTGSFPVNTFLTNVLGAWRAAHETLGVISLPAALLYLACVLAFPDGETVTLCAVAAWLGIPALRSYRVFRGKYRSLAVFHFFRKVLAFWGILSSTDPKRREPR